MENIGRYEIIEKIGFGGTAIVYKARDPNISRTLAIKILREERCADREYRSRFLREAKAVGILSHPNIVTIYDVGEADNRPYIAMELLNGNTLDEAMKTQDKIPLDTSLDWGIQLADALSYAHSKGIIHRDVKPSNIILSTDNKIKITDFGIAPELPASLKQCVDKLLKKKPEKRFQNGRDLKHALERVQNDIQESKNAEQNTPIFSIKFKWSIIMGLIVGLTLSLCGSYFYISQQDSMMTQTYKYGATLSHFIAAELDFAVPIKFQKTEVGFIRLGIPYAPIEQLSTKMLLMLALIALITLASVVIASYILGRQFPRPLLTLSKAMDEIETGHYAYRISTQRNDEFGQIFSCFDTMAVKLQELDEKKSGHEK